MTQKKIITHTSDNLNNLGMDIIHYPNYINRKLRPHQVNVLLFSIIMKGEATHYIEEDIYKETTPSLNIIHYNQTHDIVTNEKGIEVFNFFLDPDHIHYPNLPVEYQGILSTILPLHYDLLPNERKLVRINISNPEQLRSILLTLMHELNQKNPGYQHLCHEWLKLFLTKICQEAKLQGVKTFFPGKTNFPKEIVALKDFLFDNYKEKVDLKNISHKTNYSVPQLCRLFKRLTGKSIMSFVIERRIELSLELLRHSDLKIMDIAFNTGFCDVHFFNRKFKKLIGETASSYRKKWLLQHEDINQIAI